MTPRPSFKIELLRKIHPAVWGLGAFLAFALWMAVQNMQSPGLLKWSFPAAGIREVRLCAACAGRAQIRYVPGASTVEVAARATLSPNGYHALELTGKEVPASSWKFDFTPTARDGVLELRSQGETRLQRCRYRLRSIEVVVPSGVTVVREDAEPGK